MMSFDHYVYPGTNILKNKLNFTNKQDAYDVERLFSVKRIAELGGCGITGTFDVDHLRSIHKFLFQDVYDWAGEFRDIDIFKGLFEFSAPDRIEADLDKLCDDIRKQNYFRDLPKQDAVNGMADMMCRLNAIHPFREGNGRTQRMFMEQRALNAGYSLNLSCVTENDMRDASFAASVRGDTRLMRYLFNVNITETGVLGPVEASIDCESEFESGFDVSELKSSSVFRRALDKVQSVFCKHDTSDLDKAFDSIDSTCSGVDYDDYSV